MVSAMEEMEGYSLKLAGNCDDETLKNSKPKNDMAGFSDKIAPELMIIPAVVVLRVAPCILRGCANDAGTDFRIGCQIIGGFPVNGNLPLGLRCFPFVIHQAVILIVGDSPAHVHDLPIQIDIAPAQRAELAPAQSGFKDDKGTDAQRMNLSIG